MRQLILCAPTIRCHNVVPRGTPCQSRRGLPGKIVTGRDHAATIETRRKVPAGQERRLALRRLLTETKN